VTTLLLFDCSLKKPLTQTITRVSQGAIGQSRL
jgi:hypothetical protein